MTRPKRRNQPVTPLDSSSSSLLNDDHVGDEDDEDHESTRRLVDNRYDQLNDDSEQQIHRNASIMMMEEEISHHESSITGQYHENTNNSVQEQRPEHSSTLVNEPFNNISNAQYSDRNLTTFRKFKIQLQPLIGLLYKKAMLFRRDLKNAIMVIVFPLIFIALVTMTHISYASLFKNSMNPYQAGTNEYYQWFLDQTPMIPLSEMNAPKRNSNNVKPFSRNLANNNNDYKIALLFRGLNISSTHGAAVSRDIQTRLSYSMSFYVDFEVFSSREEMNAKIANDSSFVGGYEFEKLDFDHALFNVTVLYNNEHKTTLPQLTQLIEQIIIDILYYGPVNTRAQTIFPKIGIQHISFGNQLTYLFLDNSIFYLIMPLILLLPHFVTGVVSEEEKETKIQLLLSSVSKKLYWTSHFIFDVSLYFIISLAQIIGMSLIASAPAFVDNSLFAVLAVYVSYAFYFITFSYIFSYVFSKVEDAQKWTSFIISASVLFIFLVFRYLFNFEMHTLLKFLLCLILPSWNFFYALSLLGLAVDQGTPISILDMFQLKGYSGELMGVLLLMWFQTFSHIFLMLWFEYLDYLRKKPNSWLSRWLLPFNFARKLFKMETMPQRSPLNTMTEIEMNENSTLESPAGLLITSVSDGRSENHEEEIYESSPNDILQFHHVHKWFGDYHVLRGVNFGVKRGEILGLLGKNGASKTTLLKTICSITGISHGQILINGTNVFERIGSPSNLGVCPQNNRLYDNLTVWEHLKIYHFIRGQYSTENIRRTLERFKFTLEDSNKAVKELSGGMKRKLSMALALIGEPDVILLDEPTSSMDVSTRRHVWSLIHEIRANHAIILTSHSMDEMEELTDRIGIMVEGSLAAIGSKTSLKERFGKFYRVVITSESEQEEDLTKIEHSILESFKQDEEHQPMTILDQSSHKESSVVKLLNRVGRTLFFEIHNSVPVYEVFEKIGNLACVLHYDYSISQSTLEQVFLNFSNSQKR
ncbi:hypothetical protein C9374_000035 [Naegleria lovaniensis]|uniref:ABC transporter domain-containing protein n=1 Tax=Naegleria lovaniensis TaxID=51637 RepID=A0AA88GZ13_NAELO|nr:uncharacterized protein C9374_000035 [Naegleria lovaniensis]KAG2388596.1 hypothetical protein C9374_000035 [Naegleria lovaniensis]